MSHLLVPVSVLVLLSASLPAGANSSGSLRTGSGGTGLSTGHGSGGTGLSTASSQQKMTPAKPHATPPAGVRPHTDLAAAAKLIQLSSGNLMKHSQLFPTAARAPGDPILSGPTLNKIGATDGGTASFKAVAGISTDLGGGRVYPNNQRGAAGREHRSLSGSQELYPASALALAQADDDAPRRRSGGGLLSWLHALLTLAGIGAIGWWMWQAAPTSPRLALPATTG